jgi:hypothetical protein
MSDLSLQSAPKPTLIKPSNDGRCENSMTLILKRASASRPSGEWNDDDYDVLADGVVSAASSKPMLRP